ncbi:MAG TPA: hypothetical protein VK154_09385 [Chitinophagales bacterium]|nr:hypothetical protein [Chitinophagales bacterium]
MKKGIISIAALALIGLFITWGSACTTGGNPYPTIAFRVKTDSVTTESQFRSIPRDSIYTLIINASKTGPDGILKDFKISRSINGGPDSVLQEAVINTVYFAQFYSYQAGDSGDVEQYTFTVGNAEGLKTSIQFTGTVR